MEQYRDVAHRLLLAGEEVTTQADVTDHGELTGLGDDDHLQYLTNTRGDARYTQRANNLSDLASAATARTNLGAAASSHTHAAGDIASGTVATARLGGGTASASTVLWGNQTWAVVPPTDWSAVTNKPSTFTPATHAHAAADVTSGTLAYARLPAYEISFMWSANGDAYYVTTTACTISLGQEGGTGTLTYAIAPDNSSTFGSNVSLPQSLTAGQTLKVTCAALSGFKAVTLVKS